MNVSSAVDSKKIFRIFSGGTEVSPFHKCYENEETILRVCAGRFFVHFNGDDPVAGYWALRRKAVLVDVPERPLEISGPDALPLLERIFARKINALKVGRGCYVVACTHGGGLFMDGILFRPTEDKYWFVQPDGDMLTWLLAHRRGFDATVSDPHSRVLQIQGPSSIEIMSIATNGAIDSDMLFFQCGYFEIGGQTLFVSRTGWTGELGFEIYTLGERTDCPRLWDYLMKIGTPKGLMFSSMQSVNIRRIEAGILDSGSDFDMSMTPFEAGLEKFVDLEKDGYIGRDALVNAARGKRLFGLYCSGIVPSRNFQVFDGSELVGIVTTGAWSPYLQAGIGYVRFFSAGDWPGKILTMHSDDFGSVDCKIVDPPFYDREKNIPRGRTPTGGTDPLLRVALP
ncbi:MAG: aminomethyltransferase family protein [Albidovulum sp.]|nr:aminomethyltransferase family protein [Albidovulum sp.]